MHIGLVCPTSFESFGGVQEHTLVLARKFEERGHKVTIISPHSKGNHRVGNHVYMGTFNKVPSLLGGSSAYSYIFESSTQLAEEIDSLQIEVLHIQDFIFGPCINWQLAQVFKGPRIITFHSGWDRDSIFEVSQLFLDEIAKFSHKLFDASITVSELNKENYRHLISRKNVVISPAVDLDITKKKYAHPKYFDDSKFNMLFIGRFDTRKNITNTIKALRHIEPRMLKHMHLYVVGSGKKMQDVMKLIEKLNLGKWVTLLGAFSGEKKFQLMQHADLLIAPTLYGESFGMILLESLASGTPVLAGDNDAYKETLHGYPSPESILDGKKPKVIAEAIEHLYNNPKIREEIIRYGAKRIKDFDLEIIVDKHLKLYSELLTTSRGNRTSNTD